MLFNSYRHRTCMPLSTKFRSYRTNQKMKSRGPNRGNMAAFEISTQGHQNAIHKDHNDVLAGASVEREQEAHWREHITPPPPKSIWPSIFFSILESLPPSNGNNKPESNGKLTCTHNQPRPHSCVEL